MNTFRLHEKVEVNFSKYTFLIKIIHLEDKVCAAALLSNRKFIKMSSFFLNKSLNIVHFMLPDDIQSEPLIETAPDLEQGALYTLQLKNLTIICVQK